jgi:hypothetical protein
MEVYITTYYFHSSASSSLLGYITAYSELGEEHNDEHFHII